METKKFKCKVCGYIHEGNEAPAECPQCKAPASEFEEIASKKKGLNTSSNSYTMIYMIVIIVIVSLLLSIVSGVLKGRQMENVKLDKKKQILSSLPAVDFTADAAATFEQTIVKYVMLDADGKVVKELDPVADFDYKVNAKAEYPMYVAEVEGATKYILPMNGAGLWGAIWGYIALDEDYNTVHGVYFSHASETPGLGGEIVTPAFRDPFVGKHLLNADGKFASIAVMKVGQRADGQDQVDAISGGTITSKGVETMLKSSLGAYAAFLEEGAMTDKAINNPIDAINNNSEAFVDGATFIDGELVEKEAAVAADMVEPENIGE